MNNQLVRKQKMKTTFGYRLFFLLFAFILLSQTSQAENNRIVGYLPYYRFNLVDQMELDKLTHLVIAFAHPDAEGQVQIPRVDIWPVVRKAHGAGAKVLLSLGGGALEEKDENHWANYLRPGRRSVFIRNIVEYVYNYNLDGIDVDLEWKHIDRNYSGFVLELEQALRPYGKLLTAALPATHRYEHLSDEALSAFDFINIMGYDLTGPFNPARPGQHAPFSFAVNAINFWKREGISAQRMTLGLPFFGWNFSMQDAVSSVTYRELVEMDVSFSQLDRVGHIYYNGLSMIKAKTELARTEVSGVMLWELGQDAYNEHSLLRAVHQVMNPPAIEKLTTTKVLEGQVAAGEPTVLGGDYQVTDLFLLERQNGHLTLLRRRNGQNLMALPIPNYPPAFYLSVHLVYETLLAR